MFGFSFEQICVLVVLFYSVAGWLVLTNIKINYGRLKYSLASIYIDPKLGWFLFEVPNLLWALYFLLFKGATLSLALSLFILHYINRDILYPLRLKSTTQVPLQIVLSAFSFTAANGYLQCIASEQQSQHSLITKILGVIIFFIGFAINNYSDSILQKAKQKLKKEGQKNYIRIDQFLFKWIANPNYFGEIIEWIGYSLVSGHIYAWLFVFSTINVLTPAALVRSRWNKANIANYPPQRKAIFPFVI